MDERAEAEINKKTAEADQMFRQFQQEKDKKRSQDAQDLAAHHLRQAVGTRAFRANQRGGPPDHRSISACSKTAKITNVD